MKIAAVVTDIEGTTSSIGFDHDVLFPYALKHIGNFVREHCEERDVMRVLVRICENTGMALHRIDDIIRLLQQWIRDDSQDIELKALQGMLWEKAYKQGLFQAPVYPEIPEVLRRWQQEERNIYVFSSASIKSQQLFFRFSEYGDMRLLFSGYFDTTIGPTREVKSFINLAESIALPPQKIMYISDVKEELDAAAYAGFQTIWMLRPDQSELDPVKMAKKSEHIVLSSFEQIELD